MTAKKCKAVPKRTRDALARPVNVLDVVYHVPQDPAKEIVKGKEMVTILATMASPDSDTQRRRSQSNGL